MTGLSVQTVNKAVGILLSDGILKEVTGKDMYKTWKDFGGRDFFKG